MLDEYDGRESENLARSTKVEIFARKRDALNYTRDWLSSVGKRTTNRESLSS